MDLSALKVLKEQQALTGLLVRKVLKVQMDSMVLLVHRA